MYAANAFNNNGITITESAAAATVSTNVSVRNCSTNCFFVLPIVLRMPISLARCDACDVVRFIKFIQPSNKRNAATNNRPYITFFCDWRSLKLSYSTSKWISDNGCSLCIIASLLLLTCLFCRACTCFSTCSTFVPLRSFIKNWFAELIFVHSFQLYCFCKPVLVMVLSEINSLDVTSDVSEASFTTPATVTFMVSL